MASQVYRPRQLHRRLQQHLQKEEGKIHSGIDERGKGYIGLRHIVEAKGGRGIKNTNFLASLQMRPYLLISIANMHIS